MKIKFAWFFPILVFFIKDNPDKFAGRSYGPVILIQKKYKDDRGLIKHELNHSKQWYVTLSLYSWFYKFNTKVRYLSEVNCYRVQLEAYTDISAKEKIRLKNLFASFISTRYNIPVSITEAKKALDEEAKYWLWG